MLLLSILILKLIQAIDPGYVIEPSSSYQLSLNTLLAIPDYSDGIVYNFWISSEDSNALMIYKFNHHKNDGIKLLNTYSIAISNLYENIVPLSISADYMFSNKNLTILLAISYTTSPTLNNQNIYQLIQLYTFNEDFSTQNNGTILAYYNNYISQNTIVNILYNHDNETFKIIWNGKHENTETNYQIFDPCWNANICVNNQSNIYSTNYQLYTMNMIDTEWNLLSNADQKQLWNLYPSSTLYYATGQATKSITCYSALYSNNVQYECVYDHNNVLNYLMINNISFSVDSEMLSTIDVNWVEESDGEPRIFVVYEYDNTVYGTIKQFNNNNVRNTFILPSEPYSDTYIYKVSNPLVTNAYISNSTHKEYVLSVWIVDNIGLFANVFNFNGKRFFCTDVLVYETNKNITSIDIGSYIDYGIISFIISN
eukprot:208222_1